MDLSKLKEPFPFEDLEFRLQSCGKSGSKIWGKYLTYVTNRATLTWGWWTRRQSSYI